MAGPAPLAKARATPTSPVKGHPMQTEPSTATIELFDRYASNKFRHPAFVRPVRFRHEGADFKPTRECTAHYLGERPRKIETDA